MLDLLPNHPAPSRVRKTDIYTLQNIREITSLCVFRIQDQLCSHSYGEKETKMHRFSMARFYDNEK